MVYLSIFQYVGIRVEIILGYSGIPTVKGIYFINDATGELRMLDDALVNKKDIHCLFHPDRTCFIGDGYPDRESYRTIFLYDLETEKSCKVASIYSKNTGLTDNRCDLHNRFNPDGTLVSFDSLGEGKRCIRQFAFDKNEILAGEFKEL